MNMEQKAAGRNELAQMVAVESLLGLFSPDQVHPEYATMLFQQLQGIGELRLNVIQLLPVQVDHFQPISS